MDGRRLVAKLQGRSLYDLKGIDRQLEYEVAGFPDCFESGLHVRFAK